MENRLHYIRSSLRAGSRSHNNLTGRVSAAERLEADKKKYVKTKQLLDTKILLNSATPSKKKDQEKSQKPPVPKPRTRSRIDSTQDTPQQPAKHQLPGNNEFKTPLKPPHSNQKPPHSNRKTPQKFHPQESPRVLRSHTREIPEQKVPRMSRSATRTVKNRSSSVGPRISDMTVGLTSPRTKLKNARAGLKPVKNTPTRGKFQRKKLFDKVPESPEKNSLDRKKKPLTVIENGSDVREPIVKVAKEPAVARDNHVARQGKLNADEEVVMLARKTFSVKHVNKDEEMKSKSCSAGQSSKSSNSSETKSSNDDKMIVTSSNKSSNQESDASSKSLNHEAKPANEAASMKPPSGLLRHKQNNKNQPITNKNKKQSNVPYTPSPYNVPRQRKSWSKKNSNILSTSQDNKLEKSKPDKNKPSNSRHLDKIGSRKSVSERLEDLLNTPITIEDDEINNRLHSDSSKVVKPSNSNGRPCSNDNSNSRPSSNDTSNGKSSNDKVERRVPDYEHVVLLKKQQRKNSSSDHERKSREEIPYRSSSNETIQTNKSRQENDPTKPLVSLTANDLFNKPQNPLLRHNNHHQMMLQNCRHQIYNQQQQEMMYHHNHHNHMHQYRRNSNYQNQYNYYGSNPNMNKQITNSNSESSLQSDLSRLNNFFQTLGGALPSQSSNEKPFSFTDSQSSFSVCGASEYVREGGPYEEESKHPNIMVNPIEKNARIIRWIINTRKHVVQNHHPNHQVNKNHPVTFLV